MRHVAIRLRSHLGRAGLIGLMGLVACRAVLGIEERQELPNESPPDAADALTPEDVADAGIDGSRFCEGVIPRPTFCSDFDLGDLLSEWAPTATSGTNPHVLSGGAVEPDNEQFRSGGRSARFASPASTGANGSATAFAAVDLPLGPEYLFLETELRIDTELFTADAGGSVALFELELPGSGAIRIARGAGETRLVVIDYLLASEASAPFALPLPVGEWVTLKLLLHNRTGSAAGDVGVYLGATAAKLDTPSSFQRKLGRAPILRAGIVTATSPVGVFRVNIDNLRITYEP